MSDRYDPLLRRTAELALDYLGGLPERPVGPTVDHDKLYAALNRPLADRGEDPMAVVEQLFADADPGIVACVGPRYFGFVHGGALPASVAADWLVTTWDIACSMYVCSPAVAVIEEIAAGWLCDLFGLSGPSGPSGSSEQGREISTGFTTGCNMANFTGLAAGRHALLARAGWDVEADGLFGAPTINVVVGAEAHGSIFAALQMLGLGRERVSRIDADDQGRMRADVLESVLDGLSGPTIVIAQAGNVNSGAFDPFPAIADACEAHDAWLHIDGAFGLWAAVSPAYRHLTAGVERADSWAADGHKWLNVPYDSGIVMTADAEAHRAAMTISGSYLVKDRDSVRDRGDWVPESSRRPRGVPIYAAIRSLGRDGLAAMIERCCDHARHMAERLAAAPGVEILNQVVINQVMARFADDDEATRRVIAHAQAEGTCWMGKTTWHGKVAMRLSVSNWSTTREDIDRSVDAILAGF